MDAAAGAMTLTCSDYVENYSDVTGTIVASVTANRETIGDFGKKQFNLNADGVVVPVGEVDYEKWTGDSPDEVIAEWGNTSNSVDGTIVYTIRVNGKGQDISDAVVSDALKSPGMSYVEDSFTILRAGLSPSAPAATCALARCHGANRGRRFSPRGGPRETFPVPNPSPSGPPVTPVSRRWHGASRGRQLMPRNGPRETLSASNPSPSGPLVTLLGAFAFFAAVLQPSCTLERVSQNPLHLRIRAPHVVLCPAFYRGPDLRVDSKGILLASCHWYVLPRG